MPEDTAPGTQIIPTEEVRFQRGDTNTRVATNRRLDVLKQRGMRNFVTRKLKKHQAILPLICNESCPLYTSCRRRREEGLCKDEEESFNDSFGAYLTLVEETEAATPIEIMAVIELSTIDVLEARALALLGTEGMLVQDVAGIGHDNTVFYRKAENPVIRILEVLWRRRSKVYQELNTTREQKQKMAEAGRKTAADLFTSLLEKAQRQAQGRGPEFARNITPAAEAEGP